MNKINLGVGINYRKEIADFILNNISYFDFVEINTERLFIDHKDNQLDNIIAKLPCVLHGLSLSLGDANEIVESYFSNLKKAIDFSHCMWFSEHVASTRVSGIEIRNLMPVPFNKKSANNIIKKINQITCFINKPFLIENVTYYYPMPGSEMSEIGFINYILEQTDCGLLLDLNNLFCNSVNHGYNALEFIDSLPKERIVEIHLAGGAKIHDMQVDTHAEKISNNVLELFEYCCRGIPFCGVTLERDSGPKNLEDLLEEITIIRNIINKFKLKVVNS